MKQNYSYLIFSISLLTCLLFSACEKERLIIEQPEVGNGTGDIADITTLIQPQLTSATFPYAIKKEVGVKDVKLYPVEGEGEVTLRHSIYPFYAFEKNNSNGDYYVIKSEVAVANENMYKGYTKHHFDKSSTNICGYYMREMRVSYELKDKDGNKVGEFPVGHSPTPFTTIGSVTYTSGFSWSLNAQIRIGSDTIAVKPLIGSVSYSNEVKRNIQDMDVRNTSSDQAAHYAFALNNLPADKPETSYIPKLPPPSLSINTGTYFQEFIWRVPTTKDFQGDDVKFTLTQKVEIDYGICYSVTRSYTQAEDAGVSLACELEEHVETVRDSSTIDLISPCRIPVGKLKITNKNNGQYVSQIAIAKNGGQPTVVSKGSIAFDKSFETYLNVGNYKVEFKMGKTSKEVKTYTLAYDVAEIAQDETLELFSDYDFVKAD